MLVYRVENVEGKGPFATLPNVSYVKDYNDTYLHPMPDRDFEHGVSGIMGWNFGCDSLDMLKQWFAFVSVVEFLQNNNYKIVIYDADPDEVRISISGFQLAFIKNSAKKVQELAISTLREPSSLY